MKRIFSLLFALTFSLSVWRACPLEAKGPSVGSSPCCQKEAKKSCHAAKKTAKAKTGSSICCDQHKAGTDKIKVSPKEAQTPRYIPKAKACSPNAPALSRSQAEQSRTLSPPKACPARLTPRAPPA